MTGCRSEVFGGSSVFDGSADATEASADATLSETNGAGDTEVGGDGGVAEVTDSLFEDGLADVDPGETETGTADSGGDAGDGGPSCETPPCPVGFVACGGTSVSVDDPSYGCGSCKPCGLSHAFAKCAGGTCATDVCHEGWGDCDGLAGNGCEADLGSPKACGSCGKSCGALAQCSKGTCVASCTAPETDCGGGICADLTSAGPRCGGCASPCPAESPYCAGGACKAGCPTGKTLCGGRCVDTSVDPSNCGGCGTACAGGSGVLPTCVAGTCRDCPAGLTRCDSSCVDLLTDHDNCGACKKTCAFFGEETCGGGACRKAKDYLFATGSGGIASLALDETHLYWTESTTGIVARVAKAGGATQVLATGQVSPGRIVVQGSTVYWVNTLGGAVMRAKKDGSGAATILVAAPEPTGIAADVGHIYWSNRADSTVRRFDLTTGAADTLATLPAKPVGALGLDDGAVYALTAAYDDGGVMVGRLLVVNLTSKAVTVMGTGVALSEPNLAALAVSPTHLAYVVYSSLGAVFVRSKATGVASLVSDVEVNSVLDVVALSDCSVYVPKGSSYAGLLRKPLGGGAGVVVGPMVSNIVLDNKHVYGTSGSGIYRMPR